MTTIEQALQAFDEEDREAAQRALSSPFIRSMDVDYARLATKIPLPEAIEPAYRAQVRPNAAPSYVSANAVVRHTHSALISYAASTILPFFPNRLQWGSKHVCITYLCQHFPHANDGLQIIRSCQLSRLSYA